MLGAIIGDIVGSIYEFHNLDPKTTEFPFFSSRCFVTDDTILTIALAESILTGRSYRELLKQYGKRYPHAGYGLRFKNWIYSTTSEPYNSFGNGSAMRVSPVGFAYSYLEDVLEKAKVSAAVTHNHPEGIKGAQATAAAIYLARQKKSKSEIQAYIESTFAYDLSIPLDEIRPKYSFNETCQFTVPPAIRCVLESTDFEHAIRLAISLGGDSDTLACITGGIAQAMYGIPDPIRKDALEYIPPEFQRILFDFETQFMQKS
jgi:ADP-ribosylglycohydrolase